MLILMLFLAQGDTGQLNGTVVDMKGDAVPGASVKLTSLTTSQVREATTGDAGNFGFTLLTAWSLQG